METMYAPQNNGPHTALWKTINSTETSITVADASVLPEAPNVLTIGTDEDAELVLMESVTGNILTVRRGFNGTTAKEWPEETWVYRAITAQDVKALQERAAISVSIQDNGTGTTDQEATLNAQTLAGMTIKLPQTPMLTGENEPFYPLTHASQVIKTDDSRLEQDGKINADQAYTADKLGGKAPEYYIQPYNLLDNSRFEIAQEGYGDLIGTQAYACDRWKLVSGSVSHSGAGLTLNGRITQVLSETPTGPVTPAASNGTITYDASTNTVTLSTTKATVIRWAALYEGTYTADTLPPYRPKGYMTELLACQRYYYPFKPGNTALSFAGWQYSTSVVRVALPLPIAMAISSDRVPTVSVDIDNIRILPGAKAPTSMQVVVVSPNLIYLSLSVEGTQHDLCAIRVNAPLIIIAPD